MNIQRLLLMIGVSLASIFVLNIIASQGGFLSTLIRGNG